MDLRDYTRPGTVMFFMSHVVDMILSCAFKAAVDSSLLRGMGVKRVRKVRKFERSESHNCAERCDVFTVKPGNIVSCDFGCFSH